MHSKDDLCRGFLIVYEFVYLSSEYFFYKTNLEHFPTLFQADMLHTYFSCCTTLSMLHGGLLHLWPHPQNNYHFTPHLITLDIHQHTLSTRHPPILAKGGGTLAEAIQKMDADVDLTSSFLLWLPAPQLPSHLISWGDTCRPIKD